MDLVKFGMSGPDLAAKIKQLGIEFEPTDDFLESLRKAGAPDVVIQALRAVRRKPLTREEVGELVAGGVASERAAALVKQNGIDFAADEEYLNTLRVAGADDTLITALREASAAATAQLVVVTSPYAEVFLDGAPQGRTDAQGELTVKAKLGAHGLKITRPGKKAFEQQVTLAAWQTTRIEARQEDLAPTPPKARENPKDGLRYLWIPPGSFEMGCSPGDNECYDNENPSHHVTLSKGFWIGQTEVTVGAYKRFAAAAGRQMPGAPPFNSGWANDDMPIVEVTWDDAHDYCTWAGGRLPTEAEWEHAARGGNGQAPYGLLDEVGWYSANSANQTHPVGLKRANGFGMYDMLGNVWEWVNDWFDKTYYRNSPSQDPSGPTSAQQRVVCGGSWSNDPRDIRVSNRGGLDPGVPASNIGFRCGGDIFAP